MVQSSPCSFMSVLCGSTVANHLCHHKPTTVHKTSVKRGSALFHFLKMTIFERRLSLHWANVRTNECLFSDKNDLQHRWFSDHSRPFPSKKLQGRRLLDDLFLEHSTLCETEDFGTYLHGSVLTILHEMCH